MKDPIGLFEQALSLGPARRGQLSDASQSVRVATSFVERFRLRAMVRKASFRAS